MHEQLPQDVKRWTAKRRQALVLQIIRGETTAVEAARQYGLTVREIEEWIERAMVSMENGLRSRPREEMAEKEQEIKQLKQKIGDLVMDLEIYKEAMKGHPFGQKILSEFEE
jgi:transposase-like protein